MGNDTEQATVVQNEVNPKRRGKSIVTSFVLPIVAIAIGMAAIIAGDTVKMSRSTEEIIGVLLFALAAFIWVAGSKKRGNLSWFAMTIGILALMAGSARTKVASSLAGILMLSFAVYLLMSDWPRRGRSRRKTTA